jgi:hypothetical protein
MRKFVIPSLIVLAYCLPAHAVWTLTNDQQAAATSVTFSNALTNPSTIIAVCRSRYISYNTGAHDSAGNTYVDSGLGSVGVGLLPTDRPQFRVMTASNTQTTANDVITCDDNDGTTWTTATEFTGGSSLVDGVIGASGLVAAGGGANAIVFPSYSTTQDGDLIFAVYVDEGGSSSWTAGTSPVAFTLTPATIAIAVKEYATQATHGSIGPTLGYSGGAVTWGGISIAVRVSAAAPPTQIGAFAVGP